MLSGVLFRLIGCILAANYFAFQVELFDDEYNENHPARHDGVTLTVPTLTWESFDKDNAPPPIVVDAQAVVECILRLPRPAKTPRPTSHSIITARDKSPPPPDSFTFR